MYTEAINHDPAITFFQTGSQIAGRPSMGAWVHYGLGSDNEDLPAFVVLITPGQGATSRSTRGSGAAASCRRSTRASSSGAARTPVLYLANPDGVTRESRRAACSIGCASCTRTRPSGSATPRSTRASRSTRWRTACRRACPASWTCRTRRAATLRRSTARIRARPARSPPTACSRAGSPSRA